jgi:hypothetical protein
LLGKSWEVAKGLSQTAMISIDKVVPELLRRCPEFASEWEALKKWMGQSGKSADASNSVLVFVISVVQSLSNGHSEHFPRFFEFLELLLTDGDDGVRALAVDGYLQQLQYSSLGRKCGPDIFGDWMGPRTGKEWNKLWNKPRSENIAGKIAKLKEKQTEHLREYKVVLSAVPDDYKQKSSDDSELGQRTKLGGNPDWVQKEDVRPQCNFCKRPMTFVAQIDSIEHYSPSNPHSRRHRQGGQQWMFGDVGMIYVFFCFYCSTTESVFQGG